MQMQLEHLSGRITEEVWSVWSDWTGWSDWIDTFLLCVSLSQNLAFLGEFFNLCFVLVLVLALVSVLLSLLVYSFCCCCCFYSQILLAIVLF